MRLIILMLFIGFPLMELMLLIDIGGEIGGLSTIGLCIATAAVGLTLVRAQGISVMTTMHQRTRAGEPIGTPMIHGAFLMISGLFLMIPGFLSDLIGALLLIPPLRLWLGQQMIRRMTTGHTVHTHGYTGPHTSPEAHVAQVIVVEAVDADHKDPDKEKGGQQKN